jgi:hypothetical protein
MTAFRTVEAAHGLLVTLDAAPHWRVRWRETDWLGPLGFMLHHEAWYVGGHAPAPVGGGRPRVLQETFRVFDGSDDLGAYRGLEIAWRPLRVALRTSVRAYAQAPLIIFRLEAPEGARGCASGRFAVPSVAWPTLRPAERAAGGVPDGTRVYGHQYTEFALPVVGDADATGFVFAPHRPPVVEPLLFIAPDGRTLLLAPLDQFHDQIIAVPADPDARRDGVRCGWHGDLAEVPAGFASELALLGAAGPRDALEAWGALLQRRHGTQRPSRYADDGVAKLSYWTDNGAAYYYRTTPGCDYPTTLQRAVEDLRVRDVPVGAVQLDSWFYPHETLPPVGADGAPLVPPSGMVAWEPRADLFPDGFRDLRARCGGLPLIFHSRHFSPRAVYFEHFPAWVDGERAHPSDGTLFDLLLAQAARWGAITYEQDWLVESFLGVRGLREVAGRARAWQERLDRAAAGHGLTLQWCMASPADFMQTVTLRRLTSIRTSGDYRYLFDNGLNWVWFLHTNVLARALGLYPFKDVFLSGAAAGGEPLAEAEALLAALSAGPVGIGDPIGGADRAIVLRVCREDGVLVKPDVPIAALARCCAANAFLEPVPLIGETYSAHPAGRWLYVASFNAHRGRLPLHVRVALGDLGVLQPEGPVLAYNWRTGEAARLAAQDGWEVELGFQDWDYRVLCPLLRGEIAVLGDPTKYATAGDRRVAGITADPDGVHFTVLGAPDTVATICGWAPAAPRAMTAWAPGARRTLAPGDDWTWDADTGRWDVRVALGALGYAYVTLVP